MDMQDAIKIALIIVGLVGFAAMLYVSRRQKQRLEERKRRLRDHMHRNDP